MAQAVNRVLIKRPVNDVYDFVADGLNNRKWRGGVIEIALKSGSAGSVGAEYRQKMKGPGGRPIDGDYRIVEAVKDKELRFLVTAGPVRPEGRYLFSVDPEGTSVTFTLDYQPRGFAKLMNGMIQKTMQAEVGNLEALKRVLETT